MTNGTRRANKDWRSERSCLFSLRPLRLGGELFRFSALPRVADQGPTAYTHPESRRAEALEGKQKQPEPRAGVPGPASIATPPQQESSGSHTECNTQSESSRRSESPTSSRKGWARASSGRRPSAS